MRIFDAHIHADVRSYEDFHAMALFGAKAVLICAHNSVDFSSASSLTDHFDALLSKQCRRILANKIEPYVALGIHPRGIPRKGLAKSLAVLPEYLLKDRVVAVGEIGLDLGGKMEEEVFYQQLLTAKELKMPCVVHTPKTGKAETIKKILRLIDRAGLDHERVLIDHLTRKVLPQVKEEGFYLGLSAHPAKLSAEEIASLVMDFGGDKMIVSSDIGNSRADISSIPKVIAILKQRRLSFERIEKVVFANACEFLGIEV